MNLQFIVEGFFSVLLGAVWALIIWYAWDDYDYRTRR